MGEPTADSHGFRVVSDEAIHDWYAFTLTRRTIADTGGGRHERCFVDSPGAVGVVAMTTEGAVVLVEQYRPSLDSNLLEIPAGMRDVPGEDPLETAKRELAEEAGLKARTWRHLGAIVGSAAVTNSRVEIFLATDLMQCERRPHGPEEENMTLRVLALEDAVGMVMDGRIVDAKTSVGLLMVARLVGGQ